MSSKSTFSMGQVVAAATARDKATVNTPAVVLEAFIPDPIQVGSIELRPFTLATFMFLEKIGSPLVKPTGTDPDTADIAAAVYALTHGVGQCRAQLRQGRESFDEAVWVFAENIPASDLAALGAKIKQHLEAAFATVIGNADNAPPEKKSGASVEPASPTPSTSLPLSPTKTPGSAGP